MQNIAGILVNYNNYNDTIEAVKSLLKQTYPFSNIIVVDNCSSNNSYQILKEELINDKVIVLSSDINGGFSYGNNFGIKYALNNLQIDYFLLINNDAIADKSMNEYFIRFMNSNKEERIGILTGKIYFLDPPDKIWYSGDPFDKLFLKNRKVNTANANKLKNTNFASGCLMFFDKSLINKIGLLPEQYFMYCEDVDFSFKVLENNYKIIYLPDVIVWHKISVALSGNLSLKYYYLNRNRIILAKKYLNFKHRLTFYIFLLISRVGAFVKCLVKRKMVNTFSGINEGLYLKPEITK